MLVGPGVQSGRVRLDCASSRLSKPSSAYHLNLVSLCLTISGLGEPFVLFFVDRSSESSCLAPPPYLAGGDSQEDDGTQLVRGRAGLQDRDRVGAQLRGRGERDSVRCRGFRARGARLFSQDGRDPLLLLLLLLPSSSDALPFPSPRFALCPHLSVLSIRPRHRPPSAAPPRRSVDVTCFPQTFGTNEVSCFCLHLHAPVLTILALLGLHGTPQTVVPLNPHRISIMQLDAEHVRGDCRGQQQSVTTIPALCPHTH